MIIKGGAVMNMVAFGKKVVKFRIPILIISILLLIPAGLGYVNTRVNYDVLTYLPEDIETMQGQDILVKDFWNRCIFQCLSWTEWKIKMYRH